MIKWNMTPRCTSIVDRNETRIVQAMSHGIWQSDLIFFLPHGPYGPHQLQLGLTNCTYIHQKSSFLELSNQLGAHAL